MDLIDWTPDSWLEEWQARLSDSSVPVYAQLATCDDGVPAVRTVHLKDLGRGPWTFGFGTHTSSDKWQHLNAVAVAGGCWFDPARAVQARFLADIELEVDGAARLSIWRGMRPEVRRCYWNEETHRGSVAFSGSLEDPPPQFGLVVCHAKIWDLYSLHPVDYGKGVRQRFVCTDQGWRVESLSLVSERRIDGAMTQMLTANVTETSRSKGSVLGNL